MYKFQPFQKSQHGGPGSSPSHSQPCERLETKAPFLRSPRHRLAPLFWLDVSTQCKTAGLCMMRAFSIRKHDHSNNIKPTTIFLTTTYIHKITYMSTSPPPSPLSHRSRINFEVLGKMSHTPSRLALVRCASVEFPTRFRKNGKRLLDNQFSCISDLHFIHLIWEDLSKSLVEKEAAFEPTNEYAPHEQKTNPTNHFLSCRLRRRSSV